MELPGMVQIAGPLPLAEWLTQQSPERQRLWALSQAAMHVLQYGDLLHRELQTETTAALRRAAQRIQQECSARAEPVLTAYSRYALTYPSRWRIDDPAVAARWGATRVPAILEFHPKTEG